jgi:hypothetical protein
MARIGYSPQLGRTISNELIVMRCSPGSVISRPRTDIV